MTELELKKHRTNHCL